MMPDAGMIRTVRLELLPYREALPVRFHPDWPGEELRDFLPVYAGMLAQQGPSGEHWGIWLMLEPATRTVIGDLGFKGAPSPDGCVEIGYSILPDYRRQGYTCEAVQALVRWAFAQPDVTAVTAECLEDNIGSIRILEKLGMERLAPEGNLLRWRLAKAQKE